MFKTLAFLMFFISLNIPGSGQNTIFGKWITVDEESGEEKSVVEIFERNGRVYGKIVRLFRKKGEDQDPVCNKCPSSDNRFMKKVIGMEILHSMREASNEYSGGNILDPETGKIYRCRIWQEGKNLKVRGYWGPFYRTQTWKRVS